METTQDVGTQESKAEPSLEAACRKFNELFNRADAKQVAACWTEDGTLITPSGEIGKGRSGVETAYRHDCDTILKGTTSRFAIASVRRLGPELAFLDLDHELAELQDARRLHRPDEAARRDAREEERERLAVAGRAPVRVRPPAAVGALSRGSRLPLPMGESS